MIIKPKVRGFICTTAHPVGCEEIIRGAALTARERLKGRKGPRGVLVIGSSRGYGLASRIAAAFGYGSATIGVYSGRPSSGGRTAAAGWYNNLAFEKLAGEEGIPFAGVNGDAFSDEAKDQAVDAIKSLCGKVDLVVYSLGAARRTDPVTGEVYTSAIKPIGESFAGKTVDFHTGKVFETSIPPAEEYEINGAVKVMGGEDWLLWMKKLSGAGVLADGAATVAFSYIGPELTHAVYKDGTIGKAKEDLERKAAQITEMLAELGGKAFVSVNKALVTQSSAAIPVVPLYIALLFKVMKENGTHEDCTDQIIRLYGERLYRGGLPPVWDSVPADEMGRIRLDDLEMSPETQGRVAALWNRVTSDNIEDISDLQGYRDEFYALFGFGVEGVDYGADVEV